MMLGPRLGRRLRTRWDTAAATVRLRKWPFRYRTPSMAASSPSLRVASLGENLETQRDLDVLPPKYVQGPHVSWGSRGCLESLVGFRSLLKTSDPSPMWLLKELNQPGISFSGSHKALSESSSHSRRKACPCERPNTKIERALPKP